MKSAYADAAGALRPSNITCLLIVAAVPTFALLGCQSVPTEIHTAAPVPTFWKSRLADVDDSARALRKGTAKVLARTPGHRKLYLIAYGEKQDRRGIAHYNSACGGNDPASHHACGGVAFVHETCIGVRTPPYPQVNHDQLLDIQMLLYDELFRFAVEQPVKWTK